MCWSLRVRDGRRPGAFATCHCLSLPPSEPGYYFWRDRAPPHHPPLQWFVTKSPSSDRRAAGEVHALVHPAPIPGSVARRSQGAVVSRPEQHVDREARHRRSRAVSHRSEHNGIRRIDRSDGSTRRTATVMILRAGGRHGHQYFATGTDPPINIFAIRFRRARGALRRGRRRELPDVPVLPHRFLEALPVQPPATPILGRRGATDP